MIANGGASRSSSERQEERRRSRPHAGPERGARRVPVILGEDGQVTIGFEALEACEARQVAGRARVAADPGQDGAPDDGRREDGLCEIFHLTVCEIFHIIGPVVPGPISSEWPHAVPLPRELFDSARLTLASYPSYKARSPVTPGPGTSFSEGIRLDPWNTRPSSVSPATPVR
jgi:hypothetical protein